MSIRSLFVATATAAAFLIAMTQSASAITVNVALGGKPTNQSSTAFGGTSDRAVDGNTNGNYGGNSVTHTDENAAGSNTPWWRVDLGATIPVQGVTLFNRTDCCSGRLSDILVRYYAANGTLLGQSGTLVAQSPELNDNNGGNNNFQVGPATLSHTPAAPTAARFIEIFRNNSTIFGNSAQDHILSLAEVQINANNIAFGKPATQSSEYPGFPAPNATDGNLGNFTHTNSGDTTASLTVDLQDRFDVDSIVLHNRDDCCQGRLRDITVQVLAENGSTVLASVVLNAGGVLGGPAFLAADLEALFANDIIGRYIRVSRASLPGGGDDNNVLSLGELQVFGTADVPEPVTGMLGLIGMAAMALRTGRRQRA